MNLSLKRSSPFIPLPTTKKSRGSIWSPGSLCEQEEHRSHKSSSSESYPPSNPSTSPLHHHSSSSTASRWNSSNIKGLANSRPNHLHSHHRISAVLDGVNNNRTDLEDRRWSKASEEGAGSGREERVEREKKIVSIGPGGERTFKVRNL